VHSGAVHLPALILEALRSLNRTMRKRNGILILAAVMTVASLLILNFVRWRMIGSETEQSLQLKPTHAS
jgi:predicted permease